MFHDTQFYRLGLSTFFATHAEALQNASALIGGKPALRRTQRLINNMTSQPVVSRRMTDEVIALHE